MLYLVTGPPAAGKTTWVSATAKPGDITIDYDTLARALGSKDHDHPPQIKAVTKAARQAAIETAITLAAEHDVYVIHAMPSSALLNQYRRRGAKIITIDPGRDTVLARCKATRPWRVLLAAEQWYSSKHQNRSSKHGDRPRALGFFGPPS